MKAASRRVSHGEVDPAAGEDGQDVQDGGDWMDSVAVRTWLPGEWGWDKVPGSREHEYYFLVSLKLSQVRHLVELSKAAHLAGRWKREAETEAVEAAAKVAEADRLDVEATEAAQASVAQSVLPDVSRLDRVGAML